MKYLDLTMPIDEKTPTFPGDPPIKIKRENVKEHTYGKTFLEIHTHVSTHIDAPSHMIENGKTLSDFSINKFIGEAIVIDVRGQKNIESDLSKVKKHDIVFFLTSHADKACASDYFENNPVITEKTAQQLVEKGISIVGLDSFTPDNEPYDVHKIFLKRDILIVENLSHLEKLSGQRFTCFILPMKITDADGAPCRVVAAVN
ncbi:cyclase family protein [Candidatus Woesearchaeota archaeon]|nr:cyclase family protein [Candidatus Woesearchaeota archaeon]